MGKMQIGEVKGCAQSNKGKAKLKLGNMEPNSTSVPLYHFQVHWNYIHINYKFT